MNSRGPLKRELNLHTLVALLLCSFTLVTCTATGSQAPAPPSPSQIEGARNDADRPGRPYESRSLITSTGIERYYLLRLPAGFEQDSCADVIFDFHGAGSTAEREFRNTEFAPLSDRKGIILVYPNANKIYPDRNHRLSSYWDGAWEANLRERDYDIDFILELVEFMKNEFCTQDIFATGMSAGGDMVSALACLQNTPFKAFAPVTYRYYNVEECSDARPRPLISFQGDADRVVPIEGFGEPWFDPPMAEVMRSWAVHNECDTESLAQRINSAVVRYYWRNCEAETEWYLMEGGGHVWPGVTSTSGDREESQEISASELIWDFFKH